MEIYSPLPGAVSGALLRQRLPRHAAVRADYGGALCAGAAVYQPARRPAGDQRPDERRLCPQLRASYGAFLSCIVAITLNAGAYVSEIFRAGIQSIDKGQMEASRALGMPWWKTMRKVILPQAFRRILPPLGNNAIAIVKDSSLASAIGLADLAYAARTVSGAYATYWEPYLTISLVYWVITFLLAQLVNRLEKRFGKSDSH